MFRGCNLRQRVVIDADSAERIGTITDVELDELSGRIVKLIVKRGGGIFSGCFHIGEMSIPWSAITAVGREFVLVRTCALPQAAS